MTASPLTVVVGAGISGLTCAYALKRFGQNVLVLEASDKPGGMIQSVEENNFLFELGPQSFSATEPIFQLCDELGISDQFVEAPRHAPRFMLIDGQLLPVPLSPISFLTSSLLSWRTKFAILTEAFRTSPPPKADESVANFIRAKFTPELLARLVEPFVSGIFAGDPERLSLRAAFPKIYEAEKLSGSVIRGSLRLAKTKPKPAAGRRTGLYSFRKGNVTLVRALVESLGDSVQCGTKVVPAVERKENGFRLKVKSGGKVDELYADKLVFSTPTWVNFDLLLGILPGAGFPFRDIEYAHVTVVSHGYHRSQIGADLNGFGFLIPRCQKIDTLGTVWNSSLFPARAPAGHVLITSFVGGVGNTKSLVADPEENATIVRKDTAKILRISGAPVAERVTTYHAAIPQYNLGHTQQLQQIQDSVAKVPGLWLTGNYWNGPSIGACVEHALSVAESIREQSGPSEAPISRPAKSSTSVHFWMWSVIAVLLIFALYTSRETIRLNKQIAETNAQANAEIAKGNQLKEKVALAQREAIILTDQHSAKILLTPEDKNLPKLQAMWHAKLGIVVSGQGVPLPQGNRTFQLWLIPKASGGKPIPSLSWRPNSDGKFMLLVADPPASTDASKALTITEEPAGGSPQPTTKPIWLGSIT